MKKFFLTTAAFLAVWAGWLHAGEPLTSYSTVSTNIAPHVFSDNAVIFRFEDGQQMHNLWLREEGYTTLKTVGSNLSTSLTAVQGIALGGDFIFGKMTAQYVGITGGGCVYFGTGASMQAVANPSGYFGNSGDRRCTNFIYADIKRQTAYYDGSAPEYVSAEVYGSDSTAVKYEIADNTLYIEYANLHIKDRTDTNVFVFSFQYKIEASGNIGLIPLSVRPSVQPSQTTASYQVYTTHTYGITLGLIGSKETEECVFIEDWEGTKAVSAGAQDVIYRKVCVWDYNHYPKRAVSFILPKACEPVASPEVTRWQYYYGSGNFYVEASSGMNWNKGEKVLMLLSEKKNLSGSDLPQNGVQYSNGNTIGSGAGVIVGTKNVLSSGGRYTSDFPDNANEIIGLKPNTQYYVHVFPYDITCADGPVYNTAQIPVDSFSTYPAAPSSLGVRLNGSTATLTVGNTQPYLLIMSRKQLPAGGRIYIKGSHEKGSVINYVRYMYNMDGPGSDRSDTMHYALQVLEGNATSHTVTVEGLENGADYYFYAWTNIDNGRVYSDVPASASLSVAHKLTEEGTSVDFSSMTQSPAGWSFPADNAHAFNAYEYLLRENGNGRWLYERNYMAVEATSGTSRAVSPVLDKGAYNEVAAVFDFFYWSRDPLIGEIGVCQPSASDSIHIEYKGENESSWHYLASVTKADGFDALTGSLTWESPSFVPASQRFQLRITVKSSYSPGARDATPYASLRGFKLEPSLACKPVGNLGIDAAELLHNSALLKWNEGNVEGSSVFLVRYREAQSNAWSDVKTVRATGESVELRINGLQILGTYVAEVTAVCKAGDTSLKRTTAFTTVGLIPYKLTDRNAGDIVQNTGTLPDEGAAVLNEIPGGYEGWDLAMNGGIALMNMKNKTTANPLWLRLPPLSSEGRRGKLRLTLRLRAWSVNTSGDEDRAVFAANDKCLILIGGDRNFSAADITDTVDLKKIETVGTEFVFEPQVDARQLNVAVYTAFALPSPDNASARFNTLVLDSLQMEWAEVICDPVTNIRQYNLTGTSIEIAWQGESREYAVAYRMSDEEVWDTVYTFNTSCKLTELTPGMSYQYRVWNYCEEGRNNAGEPSRVMYFNTVPPCPAAQLEVTETGANSITVSMEPGGRDHIVEMWVKHHRGDSNYTAGPVFTTDDWYVFENIAFKDADVFELRCRTVCSEGDSGQWSNIVEARLKTGSTEPEPDTTGTAVEGSLSDPGFALRCMQNVLVLDNPKGVYVMHMDVYGLDGRLVRRFAVNSSASSLFVRHGLKRGFALIQVVCKDGRTSVFKLCL